MDDYRDTWYWKHRVLLTYIFVFVLIFLQYLEITRCMKDPLCSIDFLIWHKQGLTNVAPGLSLGEVFP